MSVTLLTPQKCERFTAFPNRAIRQFVLTWGYAVVLVRLTPKGRQLKSGSHLKQPIKATN
jgi:hypothetical protein